MRSSIAVVAVLAAFVSLPAFAQHENQEPVRIERDQNAEAFVFIIDDKPVAMLDKEGLHVVGQINYGGTLTDTGSAYVAEKITLKTEGLTE